ncbi:hypothetical protein F4823DRAFT_602117 [Ustulina deusta]|nr:hypothetical protein F4823DRAFT_602117 [Ustulina deusta]
MLCVALRRGLLLLTSPHSSSDSSVSCPCLRVPCSSSPRCLGQFWRKPVYLHTNGDRGMGLGVRSRDRWSVEPQVDCTVC